MRTIVISLSVLGLFILTGCGGTSETTQELIDYHNEHWITVQEMKVDGIGVLSDQVYSGFEAESGEFAVGDAVVVMEDVLDYLRESEPVHEDIKELHGLLFAAESEALAALQRQAEGAEVEDHEATILLFNAFVGYRDELMEEYGAAWGEETDISGVRVMVE